MICPYCGKWSGIFRKAHESCIANYNNTKQEKNELTRIKGVLHKENIDLISAKKNLIKEITELKEEMEHLKKQRETQEILNDMSLSIKNITEKNGVKIPFTSKIKKSLEGLNTSDIIYGVSIELLEVHNKDLHTEGELLVAKDALYFVSDTKEERYLFNEIEGCRVWGKSLAIIKNNSVDNTYFHAESQEILELFCKLIIAAYSSE